MMFFGEPRISSRWTDHECGTAEEWVETSEGLIYKGTTGAPMRHLRLSNAGRSPLPRGPNRHERRRFAALARGSK